MNPIPKLDPPAALASVEQATGVRLSYDGPCPGGEVGACYVRWPDGRRSVLGGGNPRAGELTEIARRAGVPAPVYELVAAGYVVQELLAGNPPERVDQTLLESILAVHDRFAGLLANRSDLSQIPLYLTESGPGFCLHETCDRYSRRTRRLREWVREVGAERNVADGDDLAHVDFHPGNLLVDAGRVTGVIDWDGAGRGDRRFDLVTLRFGLAITGPGLLDAFDERLRATIPADRLRAYWAHMSLRLVDWSIRHYGDTEVQFWLDLAEPGITAG